MPRKKKYKAIERNLKRPNWLAISDEYIRKKYKKDPKYLFDYNIIQIENGVKHIKRLFDDLLAHKEEGSLIFRGESENYENTLCTSGLFRDEKYDKVDKLPKELKSWFVKNIKLAADFGLVGNNVWEVFIKSRMVGMKSPFVDFTKNFFVSLFFACNDKYDKDGIVYLLRTDALDTFNASFLNRIEDVENLLSFNKIGKYLKLSLGNNDAFFAQDSHLIIWKGPRPRQKLKSITIKKEQKEEIKFALQNFFNIDYSRLITGFEGFRKSYSKEVTSTIETKEEINNDRVFELVSQEDVTISRNIYYQETLEKEKDSCEMLSRGTLMFISLLEAKKKDKEGIGKQESILNYIKKETISLIGEDTSLTLMRLWRALSELLHTENIGLEKLHLIEVICANFTKMFESLFYKDKKNYLDFSLLESLVALLRRFIYKLPILRTCPLFYLLFHLLLNFYCSLFIKEQIDNNFFVERKNTRDTLILFKLLNKHNENMNNFCLEDYLDLDKEHLQEVYNYWLETNETPTSSKLISDKLIFFKNIALDISGDKESYSHKLLNKILAS